ncbi:hypothetical protein LCGC14_1953620 [marine sediment metagenome]|uniref:Metallopeptidase domain-containing protein n=1 Tax=marine sediment metagenome TaxID=412755 RepID=A0A0F9HV27_9ZZZZ
MNDFELFKKYFKEYQVKFGLIGYKIYFKHEPLDDGFASIGVDLTAMVATVRLHSKPSKKDKPYMDLKQLAKHEALHLLIGRLSQNGKTRYISDNEIYETVEELVIKLEHLVDD